jgi:hypothetical protein
MKISVKSVPPSFRRAGKDFTKNPVTIDVSKEEYEILKAEPMLVVEIVSESEKLNPEEKKDTEVGKETAEKADGAEKAQAGGKGKAKKKDKK